MSKSERRKQWIVTEHRTIVFESSSPLTRDDALASALSDRNPEYVVSDHTQRNIYPVHSS